MVDAIDYEMEARTMEIPLTPEERLEVFGEFRPEDYAEEGESAGAGPTRTRSLSGEYLATTRRTGKGSRPRRKRYAPA